MPSAPYVSGARAGRSRKHGDLDQLRPDGDEQRAGRSSRTVVGAPRGSHIAVSATPVVGGKREGSSQDGDRPGCSRSRASMVRGRVADEQAVEDRDRAKRPPDPGRRELPGEGVGEDQRSRRRGEPRECREATAEHEAGVSVAALERASCRLCGGSTDAEVARTSSSASRCARRRRAAPRHETERHEPEEDAEGDASCDQPAAQVAPFR